MEWPITLNSSVFHFATSQLWNLSDICDDLPSVAVTWCAVPGINKTRPYKALMSTCSIDRNVINT